MTTQTSQRLEVNVKDYWDILVRRRWIIISFCAISTLAVAIFSLVTTPLYKASATIVVENEDSDVLNPSDNSAKGMSFDIFENYLQTQMSLILSRNVAGRVFADLELVGDSRYQGETNPVKLYLGKKWSELLIFLNLRPKIVIEIKKDPLYLFLKDVQLERLKGTRAIKISVFHPNAETAALIANALAERYSRDNLMRRAMTFIRNQRMATLNADYLRLQSKYDSMSNMYGPKHYEMVQLKNEIWALAKSIEVEQAKTNQALQTISSGKVSKELEEKLLAEILKKIQESSVFSSQQMNNIAIADPAVAPTEVAIPNKTRNTLVAFFASLIVGIFLAFFAEYLDDTVKNEDDLKKIIGGSNFMGIIPFESNAKGFRRLSKVDSLVTQKPLSGSAEAYRLLRIQLNWFMKKKPEFKDFAIVSSIPDEGKSTISSNTALALAQLDQKVLLVDADIRRGRLSRTYNAGSSGKKKGLSHYLSDDLPLEEVIQKTKIPNLWVVTPGENMLNKGSELLSSSRMKDFIDETRANFDMIIYDTPPITLISDTAVLLSHLHGAILVTRTHVTRSRIVPKALAMIRGTNISLIGVVLNSSTNGHDNKYYHRYYKD